MPFSLLYLILAANLLKISLLLLPKVLSLMIHKEKPVFRLRELLPGNLKMINDI